jgi:hypothetical protein
MYNFKKSLSGLVGLLVLFGTIATLLPLASRGQGGPSKQQRGARKYYLTQGRYDGSEALSACADGYHMASLWEIFDPSNLSYDTRLGVTLADSGSGPPNGSGWIRTGFVASAGTPAADGTVTPGAANCQAWTSASTEGRGTTALIPVYGDIEQEVTIISPWVARTTLCSARPSVWCVQD